MRDEFRPYSVIGRFKGPCPICGHQAAIIIGELPLLPDGRVDMNSYPEAGDIRCRVCQDQENAEAKRQNRIARQQRKWREGKGGRLMQPTIKPPIPPNKPKPVA